VESAQCTLAQAGGSLDYRQMSRPGVLRGGKNNPTAFGVKGNAQFMLRVTDEGNGLPNMVFDIFRHPAAHRLNRRRESYAQVARPG